MPTDTQDQSLGGVEVCKHCGGRIGARNPTGQCDHLYWPDYLTDEARKASGLPARPQAEFGEETP